MYTKLNIEVGKVASKSSIKPELGCVAFYGDRTIATDSFRLLEVSAKGEDSERLEKPVLYNYNLLKALGIKKSDEFEEGRINHDGVQPVDAEYPDIDHVFKSADGLEYQEIHVNGQYLKELLSVLEQLNSFKKVTLKIPTIPGRAMLIEAEGKEQRGRGLLMPMLK